VLPEAPFHYVLTEAKGAHADNRQLDYSVMSGMGKKAKSLASSITSVLGELARRDDHRDHHQRGAERGRRLADYMTKLNDNLEAAVAICVLAQAPSAAARSGNGDVPS
jgi:hypothetical protein